MALYEHVFLARQDLSQAQVDALAAGATEIVESNGGKVVKTETWGLKSLAYKIDRNRKAHFVMLNIEGPGAVVQELERQTRINEDIIRYMTIRVDEHEEGPSVMMRKNERDAKKRRDREHRDQPERECVGRRIRLVSARGEQCRASCCPECAADLTCGDVDAADARDRVVIRDVDEHVDQAGRARGDARTDEDGAGEQSRQRMSPGREDDATDDRGRCAENRGSAPAEASSQDA